MKIYLSGSISHEDVNEVKQKFKQAEIDIRNALMKKGIMHDEIINPLSNVKWGKDWAEYMRQDIKVLCEADLLVLIGDNYNVSKGVFLERIIATALDIRILTLSEFLHELMD